VKFRDSSYIDSKIDAEEFYDVIVNIQSIKILLKDGILDIIKELETTKSL